MNKIAQKDRDIQFFIKLDNQMKIVYSDVVSTKPCF